MPAMIRLKGKPTKICFKILGVPANMKDHKNKREREVDMRLTAEETVRVR